MLNQKHLSLKGPEKGPIRTNIESLLLSTQITSNIEKMKSYRYRVGHSLMHSAINSTRNIYSIPTS